MPFLSEFAEPQFNYNEFLSYLHEVDRSLCNSNEISQSEAIERLTIIDNQVEFFVPTALSHVDGPQYNDIIMYYKVLSSLALKSRVGVLCNGVLSTVTSDIQSEDFPPVVLGNIITNALYISNLTNSQIRVNFFKAIEQKTVIYDSLRTGYIILLHENIVGILEGKEAQGSIHRESLLFDLVGSLLRIIPEDVGLSLYDNAILLYIARALVINREFPNLHKRILRRLTGLYFLPANPQS